jgi:hypothetical protein
MERKSDLFIIRQEVVPFDLAQAFLLEPNKNYNSPK